jgi:hypothetical protein
MKRNILLLVLFAVPLWAVAAEVFINPKNPTTITDDEKKELREYQIKVVQYLNGIDVDVTIVRRGGNLGFEPKNRKPEELIAILTKKVKADKKDLEVSTTNKLPAK